MRPKIAVITTIYRPMSHTDVIVSRWLEPMPSDPQFGWPRDGRSEPATQIASLYIEQFIEEGRNRDIGREKAAHYDVPLYDSVRAALCLGDDELAVDGVLLIGEHGEYPDNEAFQRLYPRRELFDEIIEVFRESGRSVPVFNDKHLSYDLDSSHHMVETARELGFPMMTGSSVPLAGFMQPWTQPRAADLSEGFASFYRGPDVSGYHAIEWLQGLVAARRGGESGIESVTAYMGEGFDEALKAGKWSRAMMESAFEAGHGQCAALMAASLGEATLEREPYPLPAAIQFVHGDGLRSTYLVSQVQPAKYLVAIEEADGTVHGGCSHLYRPREAGKPSLFAPHFAVLCAHLEAFIETGQAPFPLEHALMATLMTRAACYALTMPNQTRATPELDLSYRTDFEALLHP